MGYGLLIPLKYTRSFVGELPDKQTNNNIAVDWTCKLPLRRFLSHARTRRYS